MTNVTHGAADQRRGTLLPLKATRGRYCDFGETIGPSSDPRVQITLRDVLERSADKVPGMAEIAGHLYLTVLRIPKDDHSIAYVETDANCVPIDAPKAPHVQRKFAAYVAKLRDKCRTPDSLTPDTNISLSAAFIAPSFNLIDSGTEERILFEELRNYARLIVIGPPGSGKTSSLRRLGLDLTSEHSNSAETLPILIELRRFLAGDLTPVGVSQLVGAHEALDLEAELNYPLSGGRLLLLIDGLDELAGSDEQLLLLDRLAALCQELPRIRVVLTTRDPVPSGVLEDFVQVQIQPFNAAQVHQWTRHYLRTHNPGTSRWSEFLDLVHYDESFKELVSNPLLLGLASSLHWKYPEELNNRAGLLRKAIDVLIQDWDAARGIARWRQSEVTPWQIRRLLYKLAAKLASGPHSEFTMDDVESAVASTTGFRESPVVLLWACRTSGLVTESSADRYIFVHQSFAEYCAANNAIRKTQDVSQAIQRSSAREDGSNFWRLSCALTSDADELLGEVIEYGRSNDQRAASFMLAQALGEEISATVDVIKACCREVVLALETPLRTARPLGESEAREPWRQDVNRSVVWAAGASADGDGSIADEFWTSARLLELIYQARSGTASQYLRQYMAVSDVPLVRHAADALTRDGWCDYNVRVIDGRAWLRIAITRSTADETDRVVLRPALLSWSEAALREDREIRPGQAPSAASPDEPKRSIEDKSAARTAQPDDVYKESVVEQAAAPDSKFLTVAEVASILRVSKMTVYRLVRSGELEAIRVGRSFRVPEYAVHCYVDAFAGTAYNVRGAFRVSPRRRLP